MKFNKIATAAVVPAALAGLTLSTSAALASSAPARHAPSSHAAQDWVTVRPGQTLKSIAAAHHVTWRELYATPPNYRVVHGPGRLAPGLRLRIPADPKLRAGQFLAVWRREAAIARTEAAKARQRAAQASQAQVSTPQASTGSQSITSGMSAFERCVAWRESSNTPTDPAGLFGILPATWAQLGYSGTAGQASVALQKTAFNRLYAMYGTQPWAPYDGC